MEDHLMAQSHSLERLTSDLARRNPQSTIASARQRVDEAHIRLGQVQTRYLRRLRERLAAQTRTLNTVSAEAVLGRGYTMVTKPDGSLVTRAKQLENGDTITIRWHDGTHTARIGEDTGGRYKKSLL
jgi:exodeoxyribonuclease VII large subunit